MNKLFNYIGILSVGVMLMAYSSYEPKGKYEMHMSQNSSQEHKLKGFLLNTETGAVWYLEGDDQSIKVHNE